MKKFFTLAAAAMMAFGATAQTDLFGNLPTTAEGAAAAGYNQLWGTHDWGCQIPNGAVLYDGAAGKVVMEADAYLAYGDNVKKAGKGIYQIALCMSSTLSNFYIDPYSAVKPADIAYVKPSGADQGGVVSYVPAEDGRVTLYFSPGFNNRSLFVVDTDASLNDGFGALILSENVELGGDRGDALKESGVKDKVRKATFDVVEGHKYHIVASGKQTELYSIEFTSFKDDAYLSVDNELTSMFAGLPTTQEAAAAAGYNQLWSTYEWGCQIPNGSVLYEGTAGKVVMEADAYLAYGDGNIKKAGKGTFQSALCMSSTLNNFYIDPYSAIKPADIAYVKPSGADQGGVVSYVPAEDGRVTLYFSPGFNNRSLFVVDTDASLNDGFGALILSENVQLGGDRGDALKESGVKDKVRKATFDVTAAHKYHIVASGKQVELYDIAFTPFSNEAYAFISTGIEDVTTAVPAVGNNNIYSIDGRFVGTEKASLKSGLYIMNGKKVVVK